MESLVVTDEAAGGSRPGTLDIPGVREYFKSLPTLPGGAPVVVFDDVNIVFEDPSRSYTQYELLLKMGKAGEFYDMVMTSAYILGIVVFVSTSSLPVAKFLHGMNAGTKASAFKTPVRDHEKFTCQEFGWTVQKCLEFLTLRVRQKRQRITSSKNRAAFGRLLPSVVRQRSSSLCAGILLQKDNSIENNDEKQKKEPTSSMVKGTRPSITPILFNIDAAVTVGAILFLVIGFILQGFSHQQKTVSEFLFKKVRA
jgi:hypothetical protein